jgi:phage shock protein PspC (stress-responsive transcriptional regulator)
LAEKNADRNKMIAGVCGGLAERFAVATRMRVVYLSCRF